MGTDNPLNLVTVCAQCHGKIEITRKISKYIPKKGFKRLIFTPCCNYQQATSKSKKELIVCTNCKNKFVGV